MVKKIGAILAVCATALTLAIGVPKAITGLDAHWLKSADAETLNQRIAADIYRQAINREVGDLENQIANAKLELKYLLNKPELNADDQLRVEFLRDRIRLNETRLQELRKELG